MSLLSFIALSDVRENVKVLRPKAPRKIGVPLRVPPRTKNRASVGQAFDYLLRIELNRRAPYAVSRGTVDDFAPRLFSAIADSGSEGASMYRSIVCGAGALNPIPPKEAAEKASRVVEEAKAAIANYIATDSPLHRQLVELASHTIRLAKLDSVRRAMLSDLQFEHAAPEDVQDLVDMFAVTPFSELIDPELMLLNPVFKNASALVGGADADLISGGALIDFKAIDASAMKSTHLDQLLGYLILARKERSIDSTFPAINKLGLYFCRHGHLWSANATEWTSRPEFADVESWFLRRANALRNEEAAAGTSNGGTG
jgi:hypothetical protein